MRRVPLILIEDTRIDIEKVRAALAHSGGGYCFELDFHGFLRDSSDGTAGNKYQLYEDKICSIQDQAIILLDLGLSENSLEMEKLDQVKEWFNPLFDTLPLQARAGLYLLKKALENAKWQGELCLVSDHLDGYAWKEFKRCLASVFPVPHNILTGPGHVIPIGEIRVRNLREGMSGLEDEKTRAAVRHFLDDFSSIFSDLFWYLHPPRITDNASAVSINNVEWFDRRGGAHDDIGKPDSFKKHLNAVMARFHQFGSDPQAAKALLHSNGYHVVKGRREFPWEFLEDIWMANFSGRGIEPGELITLPTEPGLPFLLAVRQFLESFAEGGNTIGPVQLRRIGTTTPKVIALGLQTEKTCWKLARDLWNGPTGTTSKYFMHALKGRIEQTGIDEFMLAGTLTVQDEDNQVVSLATPWITDEFVGVSWQCAS